MIQRLLITRSLVRLKTQSDKIDTLKQLGINIEPINDDIANLLEECICTMICGDDETAFESCLTDIQVWAYEKDSQPVSDFVDFLFETYQK